MPAIREAVAQWRKSYRGVSPTTELLLNYWFKTDHRPNGQRFEYHHSQRTAIETLIYLYEVAKVRRHKDLITAFAPGLPDLHLLQYDDLARYCVKMATGSGKTKVMALAIAWQYLNAVAEGNSEFAKTFLVLAPNVIVLERLALDFRDGKTFRFDPIVPPELKIYWDLDSYVRGDVERARSEGALYLTNIQQLYARPSEEEAEEPEEMTGVLGSPPPSEEERDGFAERILARREPLVVLNDEAHHTHDEGSEWNEVIRSFAKTTPPLMPLAQLDFSATPRYSKGALFSWTVVDYPLKAAIIDGVVKRPLKGVAAGIREQPSDTASVKYRAYLTAGVMRWREYREQLKKLGKKPVLFVMLTSTREADEVGEYLRVTYPEEFAAERLLVIHTDRSGDISKSMVEDARRVAREVDRPDSPVNAIVSVLMLREGWDVQNVTVVVGLRPYNAKANILPEQTIGRGLRRMFRDIAVDYTERVDIIGNRGFLSFVDQLEKEEDYALETFELGKDKLEIVTIAPDPDKLEMDISVPVLSPILQRKKTLAEEIAALDVRRFPGVPVLPVRAGDDAAQRFTYEGRDIVTLEKLIEREYTIPEPQTAQEVISYYAKRIASDVKLPAQFAALVPKIREFLQEVAFGKKVDIETPEMVRAIATNVAQYVTVTSFGKALRGRLIEELAPALVQAGRLLSETPPFPFARDTFAASKTVFNLVAVENKFETRFAHFLEDADDVARFAKLPGRFAFTIDYVDAQGNLRYYEPDFIAVLGDGTHCLAETKGREDPDVKFKDRAAVIWCENATMLTGTSWRYLKVPQKEFEKLEPSDFADLSALVID
ncbi:MAG: DEAD/DEAH box helicase family protein [Chloroflexota bacterium]|nr:DEAD/DEAH box helicase family protein [Chloroflexota bacterium]